MKVYAIQHIAIEKKKQQNNEFKVQELLLLYAENTTYFSYVMYFIRVFERKYI